MSHDSVVSICTYNNFVLLHIITEYGSKPNTFIYQYVSYHNCIVGLTPLTIMCM